MMFAVFVALLIALGLDYLGRRRAALASLAVCFVLAVGLFLWEVYSPTYGFRMPWLQGGLESAPLTQTIQEG